MKTVNLLILICLSAMACGCSVTAPLVPLTYDNEVVAKSDLAALIEFNTGRTTGHSSSTLVYANGIFVPVNSGPIPELQFGAEDQAVFVESLKSEMQRLGIVGSIVDTISDATLSITVNFVQTEHFSNHQQYKLTVSMLMSCGDLASASRYEVLSSEGDSTWEKWNTSASKGKEKAARKLMDLILPDIQQFILKLKHREPDSLTTV